MNNPKLENQIDHLKILTFRDVINPSSNFDAVEQNKSPSYYVRIYWVLSGHSWAPLVPVAVCIYV